MNHSACSAIARASGWAADRTTCSSPSPPMPAGGRRAAATTASGRSRALSGSGTITKSFSVPCPLRKAICEVLTEQLYEAPPTSAGPAASRAALRGRPGRPVSGDGRRARRRARPAIAHDRRRTARPHASRARTSDPLAGRPGQVWPTRRAAIMPQPAAQQLISRPSMATTAPPSPNSKASGKANIREPTAGQHHDGCELPDPQPARRAGARPRPRGPRRARPARQGSGVRRRCCVSGASRSVSRGPASIATRPPNSDSTGRSMLDDGTSPAAEMTGGASRCHHVIRLLQPRFRVSCRSDACCWSASQREVSNSPRSAPDWPVATEPGKDRQPCRTSLRGGWGASSSPANAAGRPSCPHLYAIRFRNSRGKQAEESGYPTQDAAIERLTELYAARKTTPRRPSPNSRKPSAR